MQKGDYATVLAHFGKNCGADWRATGPTVSLYNLFSVVDVEKNELAGI
jgi:hypothetical protein